MNYTEPTADVGVIIGRFQVATLSDGHRELIDEVMRRHRKVIVLLGVSPLANSTNNPLDFEARKQMLMSTYPTLTVLLARDVDDDTFWSAQVDSIVRDVLSPTQSALFYGSRDSFIEHYCGSFPTYALPSGPSVSGTESRNEIAREARDSEDWRAGVIWASRNRYPTSYQTVDVAIFNREYDKILLGKKFSEAQWRLVGGFADPSSPSLEEDARREAREEAGVALRDVQYRRSSVIDDWRYRNEPDCIKTALFTAWTDDEGVAGDDIAEVAWFDVAELDPTATEIVIPNHRHLIPSALMKATLIRNAITERQQ